MEYDDYPKQFHRGAQDIQEKEVTMNRAAVVFLAVIAFVLMGNLQTFAQGKKGNTAKEPAGWEKGEKEGWKGDAPPGQEEKDALSTGSGKEKKDKQKSTDKEGKKDKDKVRDKEKSKSRDKDQAKDLEDDSSAKKGKGKSKAK
jgi:hypothetical protein